jgi:hypothetical protein
MEIWAGAAYVYVRDGTTWTQQAYLKASNTINTARFGAAVAVDAYIVSGAPTANRASVFTTPGVMNAEYMFEGVEDKEYLTLGDEVQWVVQFAVEGIVSSKCFLLEYTFAPSNQELLPHTVSGPVIDIVRATPSELILVVHICENDPSPYLVTFVTIITSCSAIEGSLDAVSSVKDLETGATLVPVPMPFDPITCVCQPSNSSSSCQRVLSKYFGSHYL